MFADRKAFQDGALGRDAALDQGEIGRATAHIDHQDEPHLGQGRRQIVPVPGHKIVESRLGSSTKSELLETGLMGGVEPSRRAATSSNERGHGDDKLPVRPRAPRDAP